jgi:hypothetical protein
MIRTLRMQAEKEAAREEERAAREAERERLEAEKDAEKERAKVRLLAVLRAGRIHKLQGRRC